MLCGGPSLPFGKKKVPKLFCLFTLQYVHTSDHPIYEGIG